MVYLLHVLMICPRAGDTCNGPRVALAGGWVDHYDARDSGETSFPLGDWTARR